MLTVIASELEAITLLSSTTLQLFLEFECRQAYNLLRV